MKNYAIVTGMIAVIITILLWTTIPHVAKAPSPVACTQEAKLCPDGSAALRIGPNCEFAPCPSEASCEGGECPTTTATSTATGGGTSILPYNSGVRGTVLLGPTCPVMRDPPDPQCADKPYVTTITVRHAGASAIFATGQSDAAGAFTFSLPPGSYTLTAGSDTMLPRCNPASVTVPASGYVTTDISCDTGIR